MSARRQMAPLAERDDLTLTEAAAYLGLNPEVLRRNLTAYAPHVWRTPIGNQWRIPKCCAASRGRQHEERSPLLDQPAFSVVGYDAAREAEQSRA